MYEKFQEGSNADVTMNLVWLIKNILADIFTKSFQETCIRIQSSGASINNNIQCIITTTPSPPPPSNKNKAQAQTHNTNTNKKVYLRKHKHITQT